MRELLRRAGEHLRIPSRSGRASRSPSPTPRVLSETAAHDRESLVTTELPPALTPASNDVGRSVSVPSATSATAVPLSSPAIAAPQVPIVSPPAESTARPQAIPAATPPTCLKPLTAIEISQRTYEHLKEKLSDKELDGLNWAAYSGTTAAKDIEDVKEKLEGHRQGAQKMNNILLHVNKYCTIVDVAIQHQPDITALVWAGARTIIQLATNRYETLTSLDQAIETLATTLVKCEFYHRVYVSFAEKYKRPDYRRIFEEFESNLPKLYASVVQISVKAKSYMLPANFVKSSFEPFCIKFKPLLDDVATNEAALKELTETAVVVATIEGLDSLHGMKRKMEEWGCAVKARLESIYQLVDAVNTKLGQVIDDNHRERLIKCRKWIGALQNPDTEYENNHKHIRDSTSSCTWIQRTEQYQRFTDQQGANHFWVYGKPGAGKSVLSSFVITELRKHPKTEHQVLHFFCKERNPSASTAAAIACNLIDQLIEHNRLRPLFDVLNEGNARYAKSNKCTDFKTLWNIFTAMVKVFPTRIVAVVDALDECMTDRGLFLDQITSDVDTDGKVSFFLTSRDEQDIREKLGEHSNIVSCAMSVDDDIKEVPKLSAGMFRYAALLLDQLNSHFASITELLDAPPLGLAGMYERILLRLELADEDLAWCVTRRKIRKTILWWVAMAKEPLRVIDLAYVCALMGGGDDGFDPTESSLISAEDVSEICGPLIEVVGGTAQFTHLSAKEFLMQGPSDGRPADPRMQFYWIDAMEASATMAITCIVLSRNMISHQSHRAAQQNPCSTGETSVPYAINYWLLHAADAAKTNQSGGLTQLWDLIFKFLTDDDAFQAWANLFPPYQTCNIGHCTYRGCAGSKPLAIAASYGLFHVARMLLAGQAGEATGNKGIITNTHHDIEDFSLPLRWAAKNGHEAVARLLLDRGADVSTADSNGNTPLIWAAYSGHETVARLLLDRGADVSTAQRNGKTPLIWAAYSGHEAVACLLLDRGADVSTAESNGKTPLIWAAYSGHETVTRLLIDRGADVSTAECDGTTPLIWAACKGHEMVARLLLDRGANISTAESDGKTPLIWAAYCGHEGMARLLLDRGTDVSTTENDGKTPLIWAACKGHEMVVRLLLDRGADVSTAESDGKTPLIWAACCGHEGTVRLLLDRGANVSTAERDGKTPLIWALKKRQETVARLLLDRGANVSTAERDGKTPLIWAVKKRQETVARLLLDRGADVSTAEIDGKTPLIWAACKGHEAVSRLLLDRGADVLTAENDGTTPLIWALKNGHETVARLLLDRGADDPTVGGRGSLMLLRAADNGLEAVA